MITAGRAALTAAVAAGLLFVGGCGGNDDDEAHDTSARAPEGGAVEEAPGTGGTAGDESQNQPPDEQARAGGNLLQVQHLVHTAQLTVEVPDVLGAVREAERMATGSGGLVQSERVSMTDDGGGASGADITIRVPPDAYEQTLSQLADLGTLLSQNREAKDVTREVVDVESRIATQRESIERIRAILSEATKLADVVTLEGELTRRQADLESLLAQQKALAEQVNLATVLVSFVAPGEEPPSDDDEDDLGFVSGLTAGWKAFVAAITIVLTIVGALLPFAAVGGLIALVVLRVLRAIRRSDQPVAPK